MTDILSTTNLEELPISNDIIDISAEDVALKNSSFHHANAGDQFKNKVDSIFGCLDAIEKKFESNVAHNTVPEIPLSDDKDFKKPVTIPKRKRIGSDDLRHKLDANQKSNKVPDHVLNPHKWQKYSLKEDGTNDIEGNLSADQMNKKIALDFINSLKEAPNKESTPESQSEGPDKFVFKTPQNFVHEKHPSSNPKSSSHNGTTRVMKTFEFGEKSSNKTPKTRMRGISPSENDKTGGKECISLDYLQADSLSCATNVVNDINEIPDVVGTVGDVVNANVPGTSDCKSLELSNDLHISGTLVEQSTGQVSFKKRKSQKMFRKRTEDDSEGVD